MKIAILPLLGSAVLLLVQCSPLHDGIVLVEPGRPLSPEAFSLALMGDIPYSSRQVQLFKELINEVNADPAVELVLHTGDIKGSGPCDDQMYRNRFELFNQFTKPFIYTIGDNEWTDCHREDNGQYHPLERLDFLRAVFFANPTQSLGSQSIPVRSQSVLERFEPFVEHVVFQHKRIVFGTVHVVGSNNDLEPWSGIDPTDTFDIPRRDRLDEFTTRERAAAHWLREIFRVAHDTESPGVVILIQANPRFDLDRNEQERAGYNAFVDALRDLIVAYGKPVLLVHGHIHYLWIDKPLYRFTSSGEKEPVGSLMRIQIPGSPFVRWIKIMVDPQDPNVFILVDPFIRKHDSLLW